MATFDMLVFLLYIYIYLELLIIYILVKTTKTECTNKIMLPKKFKRKIRFLTKIKRKMHI